MKTENSETDTQSKLFRRLRTGVLESTEATDVPTTLWGRLLTTGKYLLLGVPIRTAGAEHERLRKLMALPVFSSDAISSVAYASEAILLTLMVAGAGNLNFVLPISLGIIGLLAVITLSYRQTIAAYPQGGGSYIVAKSNLGKIAGLVAAASLLIDYILTVAVSIAAGVHNLISLFSELAPYTVPLCVAIVLFMMVVNLRGVRESGTIFAIPTYIFIASTILLILIGCFKAFILREPLPNSFASLPSSEPLTLFLLLKAFASGCAALTGIEAISDGVQAFRKPEAHNARKTLTWMGVLLAFLFLGVSLLAVTYGANLAVVDERTVIAQIAAQIFAGPLAFLFPIFQLAVLAVLLLAANTAYADFPRVASFLARDTFLPRQFTFRGDRLALSVGITTLSLLAIALLIVFQAETKHLLALYAIGVFLSFTLSQSGMVLYWWRRRGAEKAWIRSLLLNALGASVTFVVMLVIAATKLLEGAWIVLLVLPILVALFVGIEQHYRFVAQKQTVTLPLRYQDVRHRIIVPLARLDSVSLQSLAYARSISPHLLAVHVAIETDGEAELQEQWKYWQQQLVLGSEAELVIIESPYRSLINPLVAYVTTIHNTYPQDTLTVILPEFVVGHWWELLLHNQTAKRLKNVLHDLPGVVVTSMPLHLENREYDRGRGR